MSQVLESTEETTPKDVRPNPYAVNKKSFKVQTSFTQDEEKYVLTVNYRRLDSTNFHILTNKENETKRITETLTKNRSRDRLQVDEAQNNFFDAIVLEGWLKEGEKEEEPLSYPELKELNIEDKIALNVKFLDCKATVKKIDGSGKHSFLFDREGSMLLEFLIGDPEKPTWKFLAKCRRPRQSRRSKFRDDFSYIITNRGGDMPISEQHVDISTGVRFFDEYFDTVVSDPNYSPVVFLKEEDGKEILDHEYVEGDDNDRKMFVKHFNPHFKVEFAGAVISTFNKSGRDS
jgi:hypothetical protein